MLVLNSTKEYGRNMLVFVNSLSQLDNLFLIFAENEGYTFYVLFQQELCLQDFYNSRLSGLANLILCCDPRQILSKIEKFGMVLAAECSAAGRSLPALQLLSLCSELGIPIAEVQQGLFQYGMHCHAAARSYAESKSYETIGNAIDIDSYTDYLLSFYPVTTEHRQGTVIGFPKYHLAGLEHSGCDAHYVMVITDFDPECFSPEDFAAFLGCLMKTAASHQDTVFLWKPGAEAPAFMNKTISIDACDNITVVPLDPMLSLLPSDSLVKNASKVICTVSTALLGCEAYGKDTAVFKCGSDLQLLGEINSCRTFSNSDELAAFIESDEQSPVDTGKLMEFDNLKFRNFVYHNFKTCQLPKTEILKRVAKHSAWREMNHR